MWHVDLCRHGGVAFPRRWGITGGSGGGSYKRSAGTSGGIHRQERWALLQAVQQGCEALRHRLQGIIIHQRPPALPHQPLAAEFCPDGSEHSTAQLWRLVDQKRQQHRPGNHPRAMLLAMAVGVCKILTLVFQRLERFVFDLPPGSSSPHAMKDVALAHAQVRHPTDVLALAIASLPVRDTLDPYVYVRGIAWHLMDKPKAMDNPSSTVVSFIMGHAPGMLRRLSLLEPKALIAFFDPQARGQIVMWQRLEGRSMGTQAVCGDEEREVGVVLAPFDDQPFGSMAFPSILVRPIVLPDRFRPQGKHGTHGWREDRGPPHLMRIRDRTVTRPRVQTRGTVTGRGGKLPRAIACYEVVAIAKHPLFKRLATLKWPKDARAPWAEPRGGDRIKALAHVRVTRDMLDPIEGGHIALGPLLVTSEARGRFEGKQGERRHEGIR
jgi:hypothetical protein